jgi:hypothetical protein
MAGNVSNAKEFWLESLLAGKPWVVDLISGQTEIQRIASEHGVPCELLRQLVAAEFEKRGHQRARGIVQDILEMVEKYTHE